MAKLNAPPPMARLRELFSYCPNTGVLTWAVARRKCALGSVAGHKRSNGSIFVCIDGKTYCVARIIWFLMTGEWPPEIDHRDCNASNNRWLNLRRCTSGQNKCNRRMPKHNKCGYKGVQSCQGRWRARLSLGGKRVWSGMFDTPIKAHLAYAEAAKRFHGEFARAQ